ncbi:hypothetical protein [Pedobacter sp. BMA]|uniref:hypothetical protein n=1 Tax=Pedobacter sp. BMA TaxID=1663685 RepID=UPI000649A3B6|nr:hypothetical protein [Pedobacter sp. BMA]KLT63714.1 hypothetical protein AB669_20930 [Pedobacter sp. BMA]
MKKKAIIYFLYMLPIFASGCEQPGKKSSTQIHAVSNVTQSKVNDEKDFYAALRLFKKELAVKNIGAVAQCMHFPFYTGQQQLPDGRTGNISDPISLQDFNTYKSSIYNRDVLRLLPATKDDNLSEIDNKTDDPYYLSVKKLTDSGSKLYELYVQYAESNTQAENYFAFVFGRVNGKYKAVAYYAKWPVK